jgi:transposase
MGEKRRTYPEELKRSALELLRTSGKSAAAVARDLGIDSGLLNRWRREEAAEGNGTKAFTGQGVPRDEEMARLRREVEDLREANEILKKAVAIFSVKENRR